MEGSLEVELKFRAESDAALDRLATAGRLGPAELGPTRQVDEQDRYLDTADGRLSAFGWACRLRTRDGSTLVSLKGPPEAGTADALHRRRELEGPASAALDPDAWGPSPARDALLAMSGGKPLIERLALRQVRRERSVMLRGRPVGTLSLDAVRVERDGVERGGFPVVELELREAGGNADIAALANALSAVPGLAQDEHTKLERALAMLDAQAR